MKGLVMGVFCIALIVSGGGIVIYFSLVNEAIDSSLLRFQSEPEEGWDYWRQIEKNKRLGDIYLTVLILISPIIIGGVGMQRALKK
jgi:hypothetical protein